MTLQVKIDPRDNVLKEWDPGKKKFLGPIDPKLAAIIGSIQGTNEHHSPIGLHAPTTPAEAAGLPPLPMFPSKRSGARPAAKQTKGPLNIRPPAIATVPSPVVVKLQGRNYAFDDTFQGGGRWREVLTNGKLGKTVRGDIAFKLSQMFFPQFNAPKIIKGSRKNIPPARNSKRKMNIGPGVEVHQATVPKFTKAGRQNIPAPVAKSVAQAAPQTVVPSFTKAGRQNIPVPPPNAPGASLGLRAPTGAGLGLSAPKPTFFTDINARPDDNATPKKPPEPPKAYVKPRVNLPTKGTTERVVYELKVLQRITGKIYGMLKKKDKVSNAVGGGFRTGKPRATATPTRMKGGKLGEGDLLFDIATHTLTTNILLNQLVRHFGKEDEFDEAHKLERRSHEKKNGIDKFKKAMNGTGANVAGSLIGAAGVAWLANKIFGGDKLQKAIEQKVEDLGNTIWGKVKDDFQGKGTKQDAETFGELLAGSLGAALGLLFGGPYGAIFGGIVGAVIGKGIVDAVNKIEDDIRNRKITPQAKRAFTDVGAMQDSQKLQSQMNREIALHPEQREAITKKYNDINATPELLRRPGLTASPTTKTQRPTATPAHKTTVDKAVGWFTGNGYTDSEAKAIVANYQTENGPLNTAQGFDKPKGPVGLGQWLGSRRTDLMDFAQQRGLDPTQPETQFAFTDHELQGSEKGTLDRMKDLESKKKTQPYIAKEFRSSFERPGAEDNPNSGFRQLQGYVHAMEDKLSPVKNTRSDQIAKAEGATADAKKAATVNNIGVGGTTVNNITNVTGGGSKGSGAPLRPQSDSWWLSQLDALRSLIPTF